MIDTQYSELVVLPSSRPYEPRGKALLMMHDNGEEVLMAGPAGTGKLLADCNAAGPKHWLRQRCLAGLTRMYESRHEDSPGLWEGVRGEGLGVSGDEGLGIRDVVGGQTLTPSPSPLTPSGWTEAG